MFSIFSMLQISFFRFVYSAPLKLHIYFLTISLWYFHSLQTKLIWNVLVKVVRKPFFLLPELCSNYNAVFVGERLFLRRVHKGMNVVLLLGLPKGSCVWVSLLQKFAPFPFCAFVFLTIYSSEFHKLRSTLIKNLFHHDHANKISSCWFWITTSFFPNFENVP